MDLGRPALASPLYTFLPNTHARPLGQADPVLTFALPDTHTHTRARAREGLNKIIVNHLGKVYITSDAGTILQELEVQHPAAKLLVHAVKAQQQEVGDGANMVS